MATKEQVLALHRAHPDWTGSQIAERLGCVSAYVRATAKRNGLVLGKRPRREVVPRERKTAPIPPSARTALIEPARQRGIEVHELASRILARVAADRMVDAVLDDRTEAIQAAA